MRARIKRKQRIRRLTIISVIVVAVAAIILAGYAVVSIVGPGASSLDGKTISPTLQQRLVTVAASEYAGTVNSSLLAKVVPTNASAWNTLPTKPLIVFIGAEYCPYCAFQRWPLTIALMRFGNFTGLQYEQSSGTDIFPHTSTFSYLNTTYSSAYVTFEHYEAFDTNDNALQTVPSNYTTLWESYNGEAFPMLILNNQLEVGSAFYFPGSVSATGSAGFNGDNWTQIANQLGSGSLIDNEISGAANAITASICKIDGNKPSSVCNSSNIASITPSITLDAFTRTSPSKAVQVSYELTQPSAPQLLFDLRVLRYPQRAISAKTQSI